jgi:hypothetical protein
MLRQFEFDKTRGRLILFFPLSSPLHEGQTLLQMVSKIQGRPVSGGTRGAEPPTSEET